MAEVRFSNVDKSFGDARVVAGLDLVVGVRPEAVRRPAPDGVGPAAAITVTVELVEPLGDEVDPHDLPEIGAPFELGVPHHAVHLFDPDTEQRLGS